MNIDHLTFTSLLEILKMSFQLDLHKENPEIEEMLKKKYKRNLDLNNMSLSDLLSMDFLVEVLAKKRKWEWQSLDFWHDLEYNGLDPDEETINALFYPSSQLHEEYMILITTASYIPQIAWGIKNKDVFSYFTAKYDRLTAVNEDFFQADDYIVFFPHAKTIILIHHEGYKMVLGNSA